MRAPFMKASAIDAFPNINERYPYLYTNNLTHEFNNHAKNIIHAQTFHTSTHANFKFYKINQT